MEIFRLLCFGLVIHVIFLFSIFDIYFKSPILADVPAQVNNIKPPGKRVVLISVDGLRIDSLFDKDPVTGKYVAEYVQSIIKNRGSWGVSESHVPTESRPGHVAMLAGFYEDPSAVTRGWKENPVDFDSIFNRSHCSFAWGSPDILNIFFKGLNHSCAFMKSYQHEQNFAGDTREYDNWVYDKLKDFMKFSRDSKSLHEERVFFFLHLLGQDTSGHADKPHTEKYRQNLKNVDELTEKIENAFYEFYGDDKTTFIFTSDHGMTNWGSHGAGDVDEVNTPFVAWGAGIKKETTQQFNISQADITPLLAILLGASIPVNSVGVLPVEYLNMSMKQISDAVLLNAKQISAQFLKSLENTKEKCLEFFYVPFEKLSKSDINVEFELIKNDIKSQKFLEAILKSKNLIKLSLEGLDYYQNYYQRPLLICITLSYIAWILNLFLELFDVKYSYQNLVHPYFKYVLCFVVSVTFALVTIQKLPISFYFYTLLPELLWYFAAIRMFAFSSTVRSFDREYCLHFFLSLMAGVEMLVMTFFYRWVLFILVLVILFWMTSCINFKLNKFVMSVWLVSGVFLGFFSLLPIVGGHPKPLMIFSAGIGICLLSLYTFRASKHDTMVLFAFRLIAVLISAWNSYAVHSSFSVTQALPVFNQFLSWFLLALSAIIMFIGSPDKFQRLLEVFMSLSSPFLVLSISHEGYFLLFLFIHLFSWIAVEKSVPARNQASDFRVAYFFLSYIFLSFFGLGNISSVNSFDTTWVRCFLTVFSPFIMTALILFKIVIPFLVVTCAIRALSLVVDIRPGRLFTIVLLYCNIMGLNFLFLITNKGSWLDIGTSISHYVIQQVTVVFLVLLFGIAKIVTDYSYVNYPKMQSESINFDISQGLNKMYSLPNFHRVRKARQS